LRVQRAHLEGLDLRLAALNPLAVLDRGYAIVRHVDGGVVRSVNQVQARDNILVRVADGEFSARVEGRGSQEAIS
jgi:exodeoxyribonuclease VII large subunit